MQLFVLSETTWALNSETPFPLIVMHCSSGPMYSLMSQANTQFLIVTGVMWSPVALRIQSLWGPDSKPKENGYRRRYGFSTKSWRSAQWFSYWCLSETPHNITTFHRHLNIIGSSGSKGPACTAAWAHCTVITYSDTHTKLAALWVTQEISQCSLDVCDINFIIPKSPPNIIFRGSLCKM